MTAKPPILMTFFGVSDGRTLFAGGQLAHAFVRDLTFQSFSTLKTIKTLFNLYRTRSLKHQKVTLHFNHTTCSTETDAYGAFQLAVPTAYEALALDAVTLGDGTEAMFVEHLYTRDVQYIRTPYILVSDIDDTVLHSSIRNPLKKIFTLLFTRMENRRPVQDMKRLLLQRGRKDAFVFYLSNSEQNLYPLIYSFLQYNRFPDGPLLLKHLRRMGDLILNRKMPQGTAHKLTSLNRILEIFDDKKFILVGDNTQHDLSIYVKIAKAFPGQVEHIVIREVYPRPHDRALLRRVRAWLNSQHIRLTYEKKIEDAVL